MNVCTIATRSRLAHVRVLAASLTRHNPGARLSALVVDDVHGEVTGEGFELLSVDDLDLHREEFHRMATLYAPFQLCCALKPWVALATLEQGAEVAVYLDSDIEVHASFEDALPLARAHSLVLTPHLAKPPPRRDAEEEGRFVGGIFNMGFFAVGRSGRAFLDWWRERLARWCVSMPEVGFFDDQRWIDLVPGYFSHHLLRDPGFNAAPWNAHTRELTWTGREYLVDGVPLRFFHFGGFDPTRPYLLSRWQAGKPHRRLSQHPTLARLCREYAQSLTEAGLAEALGAEYGLGTLPDGTQLDEGMRQTYRGALLRSEDATGPEPPNPFTDGSEMFRAWLAEEQGSLPARRIPWAPLTELHWRRGAPGLSWDAERGYCHWHAGRVYTGEGETVELGCFLGALTVPLAMGLAENPRGAAHGRRVHVFDRFAWDDVASVDVASAYEAWSQPGGRFRTEFDLSTQPFADRIEVHEGDLNELGWQGEGIEFLVIDAMKTWDLANTILRAFFSRLVPGIGVILHQDFAHHQTYWIHLLMHRFRDHFHVLYDLPVSDAVVFRLGSALPDYELQREFEIDSFEEDEIDAAFAWSLSLVEGRKRAGIAAAKIFALIDKGDRERAEHELAAWAKYRYGQSQLEPAARALRRRLVAT